MDLDDRLAAVVAGQRHAAAGNWAEFAALDAELGRIEPGEALFDQVSRLRIRWRLAERDPEAAAEAQAIAETLLSRKWQPRDALLRARAAIAADRPVAAWGALSRIADALRKHPRPGVLAEAALEIAEALPEEIARDLRVRLQSRRPNAARRQTRPWLDTVGRGSPPSGSTGGGDARVLICSALSRALRIAGASP
jgi:hypothetical protein